MRRGGGEGTTPALPPRLSRGELRLGRAVRRRVWSRRPRRGAHPTLCPVTAGGRREGGLKTLKICDGEGDLGAEQPLEWECREPFRASVRATAHREWDSGRQALQRGNSPGSGRVLPTRPAPWEQHRISKLLAKKPLREPQGSHFSFLIRLCGAAAPGAAREEGVVSEQSQLPHGAAVPPPPPLAGGVTETLSLISPRSGLAGGGRLILFISLLSVKTEEQLVQG